MTTISQEEENYVRLSLLLSGISPDAVRKLFDKEFDPTCLKTTLKKNYNKLKNLQGKRIINQSQWDLLFPFDGDPNSNTFDVTLMITLLTNLTQLNHCDKLPLITDITPSADLARIKYYRNHISHNKDGTISGLFFSTSWNDVVGAVGRLGGKGMLDRCEKLKTKILEQSTVPWNIRETRIETVDLASVILNTHYLKKNSYCRTVINSQNKIKTSIGIFDYGIQGEELRIQIDMMLESWKINDLKFIATRAAKHVFKCVQKNKCVTITASSGVGKTAILRHVALQMKGIGYDILLVTSPQDILKFYNPTKKTLFVIDNFCGTYSMNQSDLDSWESVMERIEILIENKLLKIFVACRLQVYQDEQFKSLLLFRTCVCNLLSEDLCISQKEKKSIAELYLETEASQIVQYYDLYDCFPLLCNLYNGNSELDITDFFQNPFSVYEAEIDKLHTKRHFGKYCALALCVMFNNELEEKWLTDNIDKEMQITIENTCEACRLAKGTSRLTLLDKLKSLENTFIKKENGVFKTLHDKIFDFVAFYFGRKMTECLIRNADDVFLRQRFLFERNDKMAEFTIILPTELHQVYLNRMICDWKIGRVQVVFNNINMKIPDFREKFLSYLLLLDITLQRKLARICDFNFKDTALLQCCHNNYLPFIQWCIYHGVDVNQCNCFGVSPLFVSGQGGHTELVKLLIEKKADIHICDINGASPLFMACQRNKKDVVKLLLDNNANINKCTDGGISPLLMACQINHIEIVKLLLDNKPDVNKCADNGLSPLLVACERNNKEIVNLLLKNKVEINRRTHDGLSSLYIACRNNYIEIVEFLLNSKADINQCTNDSVTPLFIACEKNHIDIVAVLLENRANIEKCTEDGTSPLYVACQENNIEIVKALLDQHADIKKCRNDGASPLIIACLMNNIEILKILLDYKADIHKCTNAGVSPLFIACEKNHLKIVQILLYNKADVNKLTDDGISPLTIALLNKHMNIAEMLVIKGAGLSRKEPYL